MAQNKQNAGGRRDEGTEAGKKSPGMNENSSQHQTSSRSDRDDLKKTGQTEGRAAEKDEDSEEEESETGGNV